jgi:hypothetical protein
MDPRERATLVWYRVAGLVSREQKDLAVEIIEAEIRSAQHEVLLEAAKLVLSGDAITIARQYGSGQNGRSGQRGERRELERDR